jgi:putative endonuclease
MSWHVYIVRCADGSYYTGSTTDLEKRLGEHNAKRGARYTASRTPVRLVYREVAASRSEAQKREAAIKKLSRAGKQALAEKGE